jgi:hypothetical protein
MSDEGEEGYTSPKKVKASDTNLRWAVGVLTLLVVTIAVFLGIQLVNLDEFPGFKSKVNTLIATKLLPVTNTINANAARTPSEWISMTPIVSVFNATGNTKTTTTFAYVLNTNLPAKASFFWYRKTGKFVEVYYVIDVIQSNGAATTSTDTVRIYITLPTNHNAYATAASQRIPASINVTLLSDVSLNTIIPIKKVDLRTSDAPQTGKSTEFDQLYFDMVFGSSATYNISLSGTFVYVTP